MNEQKKRMAPGKEDVPYDIRERTFLFAVRVVKWARTLPKDVGTQIVAKQLISSATSVGANIEEADGTETQRDKVYKWSLSRKEARESRYWIRIICAVNCEDNEGLALKQESTELINIISVLIAKNKQSLDSN